MTELSYHEFRALHKGQTAGEQSALWKKYKDGEYQPDADGDGVHDSVDEVIVIETPGVDQQIPEVLEEPLESSEENEEEESEGGNEDLSEEDDSEPTPTGEEPEPEEPEPTVEETFRKNLQMFGKCYRILQMKHRYSKEDVEKAEKYLVSSAKATRPASYTCKPEDGWQLWVGPHPEAFIVNERNQIGFCITRSWWLKNYQGSFLVQDMVLDEPERLASIRERYQKKGKMVPRNPIPGIEIMLPSSKLEAIVTSSGSYEG